MTETTTNPEEPKSSSPKKFFWIIAIILGLLGLDHYTFNFVSGGPQVTVADSSIVVTPTVDTTSVVKLDSTKKDTTKK